MLVRGRVFLPRFMFQHVPVVDKVRQGQSMGTTAREGNKVMNLERVREGSQRRI